MFGLQQPIFKHLPKLNNPQGTLDLEIFTNRHVILNYLTCYFWEFYVKY